MVSDAHFGSLAPPNPDLIGTCCSYVAVDAPPGWNVTIELGWGDCPAGCINHHKWLFHVDPDGTLSKLDDSGDVPVELDHVAQPGPAQVTLFLRAGPTCPVVAVPPQPGCEPRPVGNADVAIYNAIGEELGTGTSDDLGRIALRPDPGAYYIVPKPVDGLIGTPEPVAFSVVGGDSLEINIDYDTGIR